MYESFSHYPLLCGTFLRTSNRNLTINISESFHSDIISFQLSFQLNSQLTRASNLHEVSIVSWQHYLNINGSDNTDIYVPTINISESFHSDIISFQLSFQLNSQLTRASNLHEVSVVSWQHYLNINGSDNTDIYVRGSIQYTIPWKEVEIPNSWFSTPEVCELSSPKLKNCLKNSFIHLTIWKSMIQRLTIVLLTCQPHPRWNLLRLKEQLTALTLRVMYLKLQSLFNKPHCLVELSDTDVLVLKFKSCQNVLSTSFWMNFAFSIVNYFFH